MSELRKVDAIDHTYGLRANPNVKTWCEKCGTNPRGGPNQIVSAPVYRNGTWYLSSFACDRFVRPWTREDQQRNPEEYARIECGTYARRETCSKEECHDWPNCRANGHRRARPTLDSMADYPRQVDPVRGLVLEPEYVKALNWVKLDQLYRYLRDCVRYFDEHGALPANVPTEMRLARQEGIL